MGYDGVSIEGLTEYADKLKRVEKEMPDLLIKCIDRNSRRIKKKYKSMIPTNGTGNLAKGMKVVKAVPQHGTWEGGLKNDSRKAPHFHLVEKGHKLVKGKKIIGKVNGKYYLKKAYMMNESAIKRDVKRTIKKGMRVIE